MGRIRNSNSELLDLFSSSASNFTSNDLRLKESNETSEEHQEMTIFYNGEIHVCDATLLQARAIILLARQEINGNATKLPMAEPEKPSSPATPQSSADESCCATGGGLSMKRSLQRFLEKRNQRIQQQSTSHIMQTATY